MQDVPYVPPVDPPVVDPAIPAVVEEVVVPLTEEELVDPLEKYYIPIDEVPVDEPLVKDLVAKNETAMNETVRNETDKPDRKNSEDKLKKKDEPKEGEKKGKKDSSKSAALDEEVEIYLNITSISNNGYMIIEINVPVVVPANYTDLPASIFDVWYMCNSKDDPVAMGQNFTFNITSFTPQQIGINLTFSDPLYVSADLDLLDEIVVLLKKDFFTKGSTAAIGPVIADDQQRDLRWAYNSTHAREDYFELRKPILPQVSGKFEAQFLKTAGVVVGGALIISFALPIILQIVIKAAMSKVWAIFNTLQLLITMPLMSITLPANV